MSRASKLPVLLIMAAIFCALIPQSSRADDTFIYPSGYVPSDIDRTLIDEEPPILRRPGQDYPASLNDTPLPVSYDLRQHGRFPGIRNQGSYGTCWAFSVLGSLESSYLTQYPAESIDLSELHLAYFVYGDPRPGKSFPKTYDDKSILMQGGNEYQAAAFLSRMGTVSESVLPYSPYANITPDRLPEDYKPAGIRLKAAYHLPLASKSPEITKRIIMETGGVSISYYDDNSAYYKSEPGKTTFFSTNRNNGGHAVVIIGWDDDFPRENFPYNMRPENNGAWLIRNSWGASWPDQDHLSVGDEGCFWMSYEQYLYYTSVFIPEKSAKNLRHYGYDDLGQRAGTSYEWCANIFKSDCNEGLKYIGFQTRRNNQSHDIYVYDLGTESPDSPASGTLIASLKDVYTPYTGYHTVEISGHVDRGHYFSVVVKGDSWLATSSLTDNVGVSYGSHDGEKWYSMNRNPCIKAFTIPDPDNNPELKFVEISPANFTEESFREYLKDFDLDDNGWFSEHEISIIKSVKLPKSGLHTMKGIELLTSLVSLDVSENHLIDLDLSANKSLAYLSCSSQDVSGLTLTKNGEIYSVNLKGYISGDISRVIPDSVKASAGNTTYDSSSGIAEFDALASSVNYSYDTGFAGQSMNVTAYVYWKDDIFVNIDAINFPDDIFRAFIRRNYDKDNDGWLNETERSSVKVMNVHDGGNKVASVKGIEFFPALARLHVYQHKLTELDVSKNTALITLTCSSNKITALDVSKNTALTTLYCSNNLLTALDVSRNTNITYLHCYNNSISSLNLTNNAALKKLSCYNNQLTVLDVSKNTALTSLYCNGNRISALDVSACTDLQEIDCSENCLTELDLAGSTNLLEARVVYDSQKRGGLNVKYSGGKYTVSLKDYVSDITRVRASSVGDSAGTSCTYDSTSGIATFESSPADLVYEYDTGYTKYSEESYRYMDVTLTLGIKIITSWLPSSELGKNYSAKISASGASSPTLRVTGGDFPDGLSMDVTGKISGTPTKAGMYTFTVEASSAGESDTITLMLEVYLSPSIAADSNLPEGFALTPYSYAITITGQPSPTVTATGLPSGMGINRAGEISGTPSKAGRYNITVTASNDAGTTSKSVTLRVNGKKNLKITPATLASATFGKKYTKKFTLSGLKNPAWEISGNLPEGLTFDTAKATLSGTPNQAGTFAFTLTAGNGAITITKDCALTVKGIKPKLTGSLKAAKVGTSCSYVLKATGTTPIAWSITGLPAGMSHNVNADGTQCVISGTPAEACKKISVRLDNAGGTLSKNLSFNVSYVKPAILTKSLSAATAGKLYTVKLEASGSPVIAWSWNVSNPPEGWTLTEDGTLSGTPSKQGRISLKVKAVNPGGKATRSYSFTVKKAEDDVRLQRFDNGILTGQYITAYTESITGNSAGYVYFTAAKIPAVSVDEEGLYEFTVSVSDDVPDGELVLTGADEAFFLDDDGEITTAIPESKIVTVDVWLEPEKVYELAVLVKVSR